MVRIDINNTCFESIEDVLCSRETLVQTLERHGGKVLSDGKAVCPYHDDHNPSGSVYQATDNSGHWLYKCHVPSCGVSGNVISLYEKIGKSFPFSTTKTQRLKSSINETRNNLSVNNKPVNNRLAKRFTEDEIKRILLRTLIIEKAFRYCQPSGELSMIVIRCRKKIDGKKEFRQIRPAKDEKGIILKDSSGNILYEFGGADKPLPLFRCEKESVQNSSLIWFVEGEKCVEAVESIGEVAVTSAMGSGNAKWSDLSPLAGKTVYIWPDNDAPGSKYADTVVNLLLELDPPSIVFRIKPETLGLNEGGDIVDWLLVLRSNQVKPEEIKSKLEDICKSTHQVREPYQLVIEREGKDKKQVAIGLNGASENKKPSQTEILIALASSAELFLDEEGKVAYATFGIKRHDKQTGVNDQQDVSNLKENISPKQEITHFETWPVNSSGFSDWLTIQFYEKTLTAPETEALKKAIATLNAKVKYHGERRPVGLRVIQHEGVIYIDFCNSSWQAGKVTAEGWEIISLNKDSSIRFRRTANMRSLPIPERGSNVLNLLKPYINVKNEDDLILVCSWLLSALRPGKPCPLLVLTGEQGSAKSTTAKMLRSLIDPNEADLQIFPRNEDDLFLGANTKWALCFDNISYLAPQQADMLCTLCTGGSFTKRTAYTNAEETTFKVKNPIILTGISDFVNRPDLLSRSLVIHLEPIQDGWRQTEEKLLADYERVKPAILGGLFDALSVALKNLSSVYIPKKPRMADYAEWVTAAEAGLGLKSGAFMKAYSRNQCEAIATNLENSPLVTALLTFLDQRVYFSGTYKKLLTELNNSADDLVLNDRSWPKNSKGLSEQIRRLSPFLREQGFKIEDAGRTRDGRVINISFAGIQDVQDVRGDLYTSEGDFQTSFDDTTPIIPEGYVRSLEEL